MRVTFRTAYGGHEYLETTAGQVARARQQVMSGKRVEKASDDPAAMQRSVEGRGEIRTLETYARTGDSALAKLTALDTTLSAVVDKLTQAKVAALSARGSVVTPAQREAAALTLEGLRDSLVADLNTSFRGAYVFGGSQVTTAPYARVAGSWTYQGDATPVSVDIGPGQTVDVALDGQALAQGADATNILNELETLIVAVRAEGHLIAGHDLPRVEGEERRSRRLDAVEAGEGRERPGRNEHEAPARLEAGHAVREVHDVGRRHGKRAEAGLDVEGHGGRGGAHRR
jgi:flagellar hook-associated protein 3 FlgL